MSCSSELHQFETVEIFSRKNVKRANLFSGKLKLTVWTVGTPCSSLSPASSGPLQSPASYSVAAESAISAVGAISPSPPPTTEDFTEFLQASNSAMLRPFEADFSNLTLTDREQRELYEAAKCIQKAYRSYKGRKQLEEHDKERRAAIVIQNYYRRYKQYVYYRQMTNAALIIQHGYRSYCEHKQFKKAFAVGSDDNIVTTGNFQSKLWKQRQQLQQEQQQHHLSNAHNFNNIDSNSINSETARKNVRDSNASGSLK